MKLTDETAIKLLDKVESEDLYCDVYDYPENEVTVCDLQFLADEVSFILDSYHSWNSWEPTARGEDLKRAKDIVAHKDYVWSDTGKPCYDEFDIADARKTINEVARLERLFTKLKNMGYKGKWL